MSQVQVSTAAPTVPAQLAMMQMLCGSWVSQVLYAVAKLGIADLLQAGPQSVDRLAADTHSHAPSLYRILRAAASLGVGYETEQGDFALTPLATLLQTDHPGSLRAIAIMLGEEHYQSWGNILHSVRTGESAFKDQYGLEIFEYYAQNPGPAATFNDAMTSFSSVESQAVVAGYDFSGIRQVVDVAGGHGGLLIDILQANPHLQGLLFDLPAVVAGAEAGLISQGLSDRCQIVSGSFFETVPAGADAYLMKHILHDWDDERAIAILQQCHRAMAPGGKVLVVEQVIPADNDPFIGKLLDVNMLMMCPGGRERTATEYASLFQRAGFRLTRIVPTQSDVSIVEGVQI